MTSSHILANIYISRKTKKDKYEWCEHNLMTYFDHLKYEEFAKNTHKYFQEVPLINFDIIRHECRGDQLNYQCNIIE